MPKVLKPFLNNGKIVHPGANITADPLRHAELARNGLVTPPSVAAAKPTKANAKPSVAKPTKAPGLTRTTQPDRRRAVVGKAPE